jgi:hypothetical protein
MGSLIQPWEMDTTKKEVVRQRLLASNDSTMLFFPSSVIAVVPETNMNARP